jgi:hypothetical protein
MKDGNTGSYNGVDYVAVTCKSMQCDGCAGKRPDGSIDLEFCNAMPDCMACDRRDRRNVVFVDKNCEITMDIRKHG